MACGAVSKERCLTDAACPPSPWLASTAPGNTHKKIKWWTRSPDRGSKARRIAPATLLRCLIAPGGMDTEPTGTPPGGMRLAAGPGGGNGPPAPVGPSGVQPSGLKAQGSRHLHEGNCATLPQLVPSGVRPSGLKAAPAGGGTVPRCPRCRCCTSRAPAGTASARPLCPQTRRSRAAW